MMIIINNNNIREGDGYTDEDDVIMLCASCFCRIPTRLLQLFKLLLFVLH